MAMSPTEILKQQIESAKNDLKELDLQESMLKRNFQQDLAKLEQTRRLTMDRIKEWSDSVESTVVPDSE